MAKEKKMKFKIIALSANDKATDWVMKIKSPFGLTEARCNYSINIEIDEEYFANKISSIESKIKDVEAKPDMFEDYKTTLKSLKENIEGVKEEKETLKGMEIDEFAVVVEQVDFAKDILTLEIPEEVVADLIKLRHDVEAFVVNLK